MQADNNSSRIGHSVEEMMWGARAHGSQLPPPRFWQPALSAVSITAGNRSEILDSGVLSVRVA